MILMEYIMYAMIVFFASVGVIYCIKRIFRMIFDDLEIEKFKGTVIVSLEGSAEDIEFTIRRLIYKYEYKENLIILVANKGLSCEEQAICEKRKQTIN